MNGLICEWYCQGCGNVVEARQSGNNLPRCKCNARRWGRKRPTPEKRQKVIRIMNERDARQAREKERNA